MKVRLLAFASAVDAIGSSEMELELAAGSRVADLAGELLAAHPALADLWPRLAIAVDGRVADEDMPLREGAEVALLPPVSGGAPPAAELVTDPIDLEAVSRRVASPERGAHLLFVGRVRNSHRGRPVERLTYDAYRPMAERALGRIVEELEAAGHGLRVAIVHRLGAVAVGEASVAIAAAAAHRAEAYAASRRALERLKTEVPIWKREHYADGEAEWREEEPLADGPGESEPLEDDLERLVEAELYPDTEA